MTIEAGVGLLVLGFNCAMFCVIKFNDMAHLAIDVKEIKDNLKCLVDNAQKMEVRMGEQEVRCKLLHKRSRRTP